MACQSHRLYKKRTLRSRLLIFCRHLAKIPRNIVKFTARDCTVGTFFFLSLCTRAERRRHCFSRTTVDRPAPFSGINRLKEYGHTVDGKTV